MNAQNLEPPTAEVADRVDKYYLSPSFGDREAELAALVDEAKRMDAHLEGTAVLQVPTECVEVNI